MPLWRYKELRYASIGELLLPQLCCSTDGRSMRPHLSSPLSINFYPQHSGSCSSWHCYALPQLPFLSPSFYPFNGPLPLFSSLTTETSLSQEIFPSISIANRFPSPLPQSHLLFSNCSTPHHLRSLFSLLFLLNLQSRNFWTPPLERITSLTCMEYPTSHFVHHQTKS